MNSSNETLPVPDTAHTFRVMRLTLYPLVMFSGISGNIIVAMVIILNRPRDLKPSVRYFILNLAISDLIVLIMFIPFDLAYLEMTVWVFGEAMCKMVNTLNYAFVTVSGTTLAAISLDRHRSIVYPIKKPLSTRTTKAAIVLIWAYAILTLVPFIDSLHVTDDLICGNDRKWWPSEVAFQLTFVFSLLVPGCGLPLCCITLCYISIGYSLSRQSKSSTFRASHRTRQNRKTIKVLTSLVAVYAVSILPHYVILAMSIFMPAKTARLRYIHEVHEFTRLMMTTNSCLNPIMYSAISKDFRDRMRYICCRRRFWMRGDVNPVRAPAVVRMNHLAAHRP